MRFHRSGIISEAVPEITGPHVSVRARWLVFGSQFAYYKWTILYSFSFFHSAAVIVCVCVCVVRESVLLCARRRREGGFRPDVRNVQDHQTRCVHARNFYLCSWMNLLLSKASELLNWFLCYIGHAREVSGWADGDWEGRWAHNASCWEFRFWLLVNAGGIHNCFMCVEMEIEQCEWWERCQQMGQVENVGAFRMTSA